MHACCRPFAHFHLCMHKLMHYDSHVDVVLVAVVSGISLHANRFLFVAHLGSMHSDNSGTVSWIICCLCHFLSVSFSDGKLQFSQMG